MRCECGKNAIEKIGNRYYCKECYSKRYLSLVERSIRRYGILKRGERVLAAVSGGKDSVAMIAALKELEDKLGIKVEALHINLGIGEYSRKSEEVCRELCDNLGIPLHVVNLSEYGFTISDVRKKACSVCGNAKRYIMNRFAREQGFDVVATGHCAEDVVANVLKNLYSGNFEWSEKLLPRIEGYFKFVSKAKPLYEIGEKENLLFVLSRRLIFLPDECPKAPDQKWKELVYVIEKRIPGFKKGVLRSLVRREKVEGELKSCKICGEPTSTEVCQFCRNVKKFGKVRKIPL